VASSVSPSLAVPALGRMRPCLFLGAVGATSVSDNNERVSVRGTDPDVPPEEPK
jgi:hypothetical protein